mmetsp:Transcript_108567/g.337313  ORF Transcript_108567/g.337313 Transcript_108567/m.337313 type:complete len:257 (-) Transcript_108567:458-1228(-)
MRRAVSAICRATSRSRQALSRPPCSSNSKCWTAVLNALTSGIFARISCTSSGLEACMRSTLRPRRSASWARRFSADSTTRRCGMRMRLASASSATHHARPKSRKPASTATTWAKPGAAEAKRHIMSSNLLSSQRELRPATHGSVWLKCFSRPQSHVGCKRPVAKSFSPCGLPPQMLACWLTEKAQIQYVSESRPPAASICSRTSRSSSSSLEIRAKVHSDSASAITAAMRSRKRLSQLWVTIFWGVIGLAPETRVA